MHRATYLSLSFVMYLKMPGIVKRSFICFSFTEPPEKKKKCISVGEVAADIGKLY